MLRVNCCVLADRQAVAGPDFLAEIRRAYSNWYPFFAPACTPEMFKTVSIKAETLQFTNRNTKLLQLKAKRQQLSRTGSR